MKKNYLEYDFKNEKNVLITERKSFTYIADLHFYLKNLKTKDICIIGKPIIIEKNAG